MKSKKTSLINEEDKLVNQPKKEKVKQYGVLSKELLNYKTSDSLEPQSLQKLKKHFKVETKEDDTIDMDAIKITSTQPVKKNKNQKLIFRIVFTLLMIALVITLVFIAIKK